MVSPAGGSVGRSPRARDYRYPAASALADNQKYKIVWQVLQALRAQAVIPEAGFPDSAAW